MIKSFILNNVISGSTGIYRQKISLYLRLQMKKNQMLIKQDIAIDIYVILKNDKKIKNDAIKMNANVIIL